MARRVREAYIIILYNFNFLYLIHLYHVDISIGGTGSYESIVENISNKSIYNKIMRFNFIVKIHNNLENTYYENKIAFCDIISKIHNDIVNDSTFGHWIKNYIHEN